MTNELTITIDQGDIERMADITSSQARTFLGWLERTRGDLLKEILEEKVADIMADDYSRFLEDQDECQRDAYYDARLHEGR